MLLNINFPGQLQWRSHEYDGATKAFGKVAEVSHVQSLPTQGVKAIRWFPPSEEISPLGYNIMQETRKSAPLGVFHINDVRGYLTMHDKLEAFAVWSKENVPFPVCFAFSDAEECRRRIWNMPYPFLLRVNNSVAGFNSWLVREPSQFEACLTGVCEAHRRDVENKRGVNNRMFCVQYINTQHPDYPLNVSYRIIVAGGKVVTGYARVSDPQDWVAVTNKFHSGIADAWLFHNRRCQELMTTQADLLVKAVSTTGMSHQGLDVIQDAATGQIYILETQTTYDAGFIGAGPYVPPYYNPYNPELVKFIKENYAMLEREIPLYVHAWLDKAEHFRQCYANLAKQAGL